MLFIDLQQKDLSKEMKDMAELIVYVSVACKFRVLVSWTRI